MFSIIVNTPKKGFIGRLSSRLRWGVARLVPCCMALCTWPLGQGNASIGTVVAGGFPYVEGQALVEIRSKNVPADGFWQGKVIHCQGETWQGPRVSARDGQSVVIPIGEDGRVRSGLYSIEFQNELLPDVPGDELAFIESVVVTRPDGTKIECGSPSLGRGAFAQVVFIINA